MGNAGAREIRLEVDIQNEAAVRFYERMGFRTARTLPDYYGPGRDGFRMTRKLKAQEARLPLSRHPHPRQ